MQPVRGHVCSVLLLDEPDEPVELDPDVAWQLTAVQPVAGHVRVVVLEAADAEATEETCMFDTTANTPIPVMANASRTMIVFSSSRDMCSSFRGL